MNDEARSAELLGLLEAEAFLRLVEEYGGTRLYIPRSGVTTDLAKRLGARAAGKTTAARR